MRGDTFCPTRRDGETDANGEARLCHGWSAIVVNGRDVLAVAPLFVTATFALRL